MTVAPSLREAVRNPGRNVSFWNDSPALAAQIAWQRMAARISGASFMTVCFAPCMRNSSA